MYSTDPKVADSHWLVLFGSLEHGIYEPGSRIRIRESDNATIPIVIVCTNKDQAVDANQLNAFAAEAVSNAQAVLPRIRTFLDCLKAPGIDIQLIGNQSTKWYAVWYLKRGDMSITRTIFANYFDYSKLTVKNPAPGQQHHRKFYSLVSTVVWLLSRGSSDFLIEHNLHEHVAPIDREMKFETPDTRIRNLNPNIITVSDDKGELPQFHGSSPGAGTSVIDLVTPPNPAPPTVLQRDVTPTPSLPARKRQGGAAKHGIEETQPMSLSTVFALKKALNFPGSPTSWSSFATSISTNGSISAHRTPALSTPTPSTAASSSKRQPAAPPSVFIHCRDVDGSITRTLMTNDPAAATIELPTSDCLPMAVLDYLRSHGFSKKMVMVVETAWAAAGADPEDDSGFVNALSIHGLPVAERLIHLACCSCRRKLTTAEKARAKRVQAERRATWQKALNKAQDALQEAAAIMQAKVPGHQLNYYVRAITQTITRSHVKPRKCVSNWNAFLSQELRRLNQEREHGTAPIKSSDISKELAVKWKAMSKAEQIELTEDTVAALQDAREAKELGQHNSQLTSFHDARAVVSHIQREIMNVNQRTGLEFLIFAVRKDLKQYNAPYVFKTSDSFDQFFHSTTKFTLTDLTLKLESFFIGGVEGVARNYVERLVQLKSLTAALIKQKLGDTAGYQVSHMVYSNFDEAITLKHAVIIKGWLLPKFSCPSHVTSCSDIELLYNAWQSGTAHFVKLNDEEFEDWRTQYLQRHEARGNITTPTPGDTISTITSHDTNMATVDPANPSSTGSTSPLASAPPPPPPSTAPLAPSFVNFGADGNVVAPKARKQRKDKGVPRGPRKGKENQSGR